MDGSVYKFAYFQCVKLLKYITVVCSNNSVIFQLGVHVYLPIWPVPNDVLVQHDKERPMRLSSTPEFIFKTATSSKIVKEAIKRYKYFIFRGDAADHECSSQAIKISTFTIVVRNESEALNIDTNYDYELIISTKTKDATIVANSPFGIMYVMWMLFSLYL